MKGGNPMKTTTLIVFVILFFPMHIFMLREDLTG
jgi:hypothetical protein